MSSRSASPPAPPAALESQHLGQLLLLLSFDTLLCQSLLCRLVIIVDPPRAKQVAGAVQGREGVLGAIYSARLEMM